MALLINPATPLGSVSVSGGDNEIRDLKQAIIDIFGLPSNTTISAAPITVNSSGELLTVGNILSTLRVNAGSDSFVSLGLIINQDANDDQIVALKSSDISNPFSTLFQSNTFGAFQKAAALSGGLHIQGVTDSSGVQPLLLEGLATSPGSLTTSSAVPAVLLAGRKSDGGTGATALAANENLWGVGNTASNVVILAKADGRLWLRPGNSGVAASTSYDELVIEGESGAAMGISLLTPTNTQTQTIAFGDPQDNDVGFIQYNHSTNLLTLNANGGALTLDSGNLRLNTGVADAFNVLGEKVFIGDSVNGDMDRGLTINMKNAAEPAGLAIKHGDSNHGITGQTETDTIIEIGWTGTTGYIEGFGNAQRALQVLGIGSTADTAKNGSALAPVHITSYIRDGTGFQAVTANGNLFVAANASTAKFIVDAEGDLHVDGSSSLSTFDDYDDVKLLTTLKSVYSLDLRERYAEWVTEYAPVLAAAGIVHYNDDGNHFVSYKGTVGLIIDTIRQLYERIEKLEGERTWKRRIKSAFQRGFKELRIKSRILKAS